jgi:DNA-binding NarL/FixJ family response regulator
MPCRVLLAEDHQIVRQGLRALLEKAGHSVVGEAADGREACELAQKLQPNIAVLDLAMPLLNGLDAIGEIRRVSPNTVTILLTMYTDRPYVLQALQAGAKGYVLKTQAADDLVRAIQEVRRGAVYLSPGVAVGLVDAYLSKEEEPKDPLTARERQILQLVAEGKTTKAIGELLGITFKTAATGRQSGTALAEASRSRNAMNFLCESAGIPGYATGVEWAKLETPNLIERHSS